MSKPKLKSQPAKTRGKARNSNGPQLTRRIELVCALLLSICIIVLHVHRASRAGPLWRDEVGTLNMGTMPSLSETWSLLSSESFPILIYVLVRIWTALGWHDVDAGLRILGAVVGVGGVLSLWFAKRLFGQQAPVLSLALFGVNTTVVLWGDSLRAYGLGALLIVLLYGLIWKVALSPTLEWFLPAALVSIVSVQCLYQNAFLVFAICVGGCCVCLRHRMWKATALILAIGAVSALSLIPYAPVISRALPMGPLIQQPFDFSHLLDVFTNTIGSGADVLLWAWLIGAGLSIITGFAVVFLFRKDGLRERERADLALFSSVVLVVGVVAFFVFLKSVGLTTESWYYILIMALMALSIDALIEIGAVNSPIRLLRIGVSVVLAIVAIPIAWNQASLRQTNMDIISNQVAQKASKLDFVVVIPWFNGITFQNYYRGATSWSTAPPMRDLRLTRYDLLKEQLVLDRPLQPIFQAMEKSLKSGGRVWVVGELSVPPPGQLPPSLPPAPNGPHGWYSGDYLSVWNLQVGHFIQTHSTSGERVNVLSNQAINPYEESHLLVFSGWR
jgi:hypothetical protein